MSSDLGVRSTQKVQYKIVQGKHGLKLLLDDHSEIHQIVPILVFRSNPKRNQVLRTINRICQAGVHRNSSVILEEIQM